MHPSAWSSLQPVLWIMIGFVALAGEYFGSMKKQPRLAPQEGKFSGRRVQAGSAILSRPSSRLRSRRRTLRSEMDCAARVYSVALGGGTSSRLFVRGPRETRFVLFGICAVLSLNRHWNPRAAREHERGKALRTCKSLHG